MRLRPLSPGRRVGVHCELAGLTKSTSFPMVVRIGIGGRAVGHLKRIAAIRSACGTEKKEMRVGPEGVGEKRLERGTEGGFLKQEVELWGVGER